MSKKMLKALNGNNNGIFKKWLDTLDHDPQIAWHPSAANDFRFLMYLNNKLHNHQENQENITDIKEPEIFIYTGYFPHENSRFLQHPKLFHRDWRTRIFIKDIEYLPDLNLELHEELDYNATNCSMLNKAVFMHVTIRCEVLGEFTRPILYLFAENETFFKDIVLPNQGRISHIIHNSGRAYTVNYYPRQWIQHILKEVKCELYLQGYSLKNCFEKNCYYTSLDSYFFQEMCPEFANEQNHYVQLKSLRTGIWDNMFKKVIINKE